jgi:hypothetical protein
MRILPILLLALAAAGPAAAQIVRDPVLQAREAELFMQQQALQQQSVAQANQLSALEAQLQTERNLAAIRAQSARPSIPQPYVGAYASTSTTAGAGKLVSIPDDRLAASNAAVRAASQGH